MTPHLWPGGNARVLHAIAPGPVGGAESVVLGLTAGLAEAGVEVVLAVLSDASSGPFIARARAEGREVEVLDSPGRNYLRDWSALRRIVRKHEIHARAYPRLPGRHDGVPCCSVRAAPGRLDGARLHRWHPQEPPEPVARHARPEAGRCRDRRFVPAGDEAGLDGRSRRPDCHDPECLAPSSHVAARSRRCARSAWAGRGCAAARLGRPPESREGRRHRGRGARRREKQRRQHLVFVGDGPERAGTRGAGRRTRRRITGSLRRDGAGGLLDPAGLRRAGAEFTQ